LASTKRFGIHLLISNNQGETFSSRSCANANCYGNSDAHSNYQRHFNFRSGRNSNFQECEEDNYMCQGRIKEEGDRR